MHEKRPERLLHPELIERLPITAGIIRDQLDGWVDVTAASASKEPGVPVSILIRSRNNAPQIEALFSDIDEQQYQYDPEIIVVDTESTDGTVEMAQRRGASVVSIAQRDFSYPRSMNLGFAAASNEWVLSLVDHSRLSHRHILDIARRWNSRHDVGVIAGVSYPSDIGSRTERLAASVYAPWFLYDVRWDKPALLANNCAFIRKSVWRELGGFDDDFGAGGEDGALGNAIIRSGGHIVIDPALVVHHSHGLGPINYARQLKYWLSVSKPVDFDQARLNRYRPDLGRN